MSYSDPAPLAKMHARTIYLRSNLPQVVAEIEKKLPRFATLDVLAVGFARYMLAETESIIAKLLVNKPSARARVRRLSGGQRQSIVIARAISWGSSFVIMDEPTAASGVRETKAVEELMLRLRNEGIAQLDRES